MSGGLIVFIHLYNHVYVAQLSLALKEVANGYTPYHKINQLGMHIHEEVWWT